MVRQKYEKGNGWIDTNAFVTQIASNQLNYLVYRGIVHTFHLPIAGGARLYLIDIQDTLIAIKCPISWASFFLRNLPWICWHFLLIINIFWRCFPVFDIIVHISSCSMLTQFLCKWAFCKCFLQHSTWLAFKWFSFAEAICIALMGLKCTFRNKHFDQSLLMTKGNNVRLVKIVSSLRQFDTMNNKEGSDQNIWGASFSIESSHQSTNILGQLPKIYFQDDLSDIKYSLKTHMRAVMEAIILKIMLFETGGDDCDDDDDDDVDSGSGGVFGESSKHTVGEVWQQFVATTPPPFYTFLHNWLHWTHYWTVKTKPFSLFYTVFI